MPPEVNLRNFPYMPLDVLRLRDSSLAAVASAEDFRAAVLLWCASWHQQPAASLPQDDAILAGLAGYGRDVASWKRVKEGALRCFVLCSDGRLYHPVIAEKALEAWGSKVKRDRVREVWRDRKSMSRRTSETMSRGRLEDVSRKSTLARAKQNKTENNRKDLRSSLPTACAENKSLQEKDLCSEPNDSAHEPANGSGFIFPTARQGIEWEVSMEKLAEWEESYPSVDIPTTLLEIRQWLRDNPGKLKTPTGMPRFIGRWMQREQDK